MFSVFLSLLILLVYSGGIAVLFLFASFVLDTNFFFLKSFSKNNYTNLLFLFLIGFKFVTLFFQNYNNLFYISEKLNLSLFSYKIQLFSYMLYEKYPIFLIFIALILLVAMLGSIGSFNRLGISQLYVGKKSYKSVKKWFNYSDENNSKELFLLSCWKTW
jgi:NADH:ubiquinone oxidoreductase subunit 6 (subunit J)